MDSIRIIIVTILYSTCFLFSIAMIEVLITSHRLRLLTQISFTMMFLLLSGALFPTIYLPLYVQILLSYIFSTEALYWLQEVVLNDRLFVDYIPLLTMTGIGFFLLLGIALGKERIRQ